MENLQNGESLRTRLGGLDGRSYRTYKEICGEYAFDRCTIHIDHVQGDPFAAPSKLRVRVSRKAARFPNSLFDTSVRRVAFEDFIARAMRDAIATPQRHSHPRSLPDRDRRGSGSSGSVSIDAGGQEVLQRTAAVVTPDWVEVRLQVGLPAAGRRILGRAAQELVCDLLPRFAEAGIAELPLESARRFVDCVDNQEAIRRQLSELGLIAFVADGSVLPRESGASDRPLREAVPFESPPSLRVEVPLLHPIASERGETKILTGMGIRRGVTLIVGGGYHGKSTLLRAIERGVYPHIPGDGREWVVSERTLVNIRAEDGRRVEQVDIDGFISGLPGGRSTLRFDSDDASGSTSQAANIMESLEAGATGLLLDEDTCATNFMVRDARMQALIRREDEPITPFVERVRELHDSLGISSVLVMGGSGDYFDESDTVIAMREFLPSDVTSDAKRIAAASASAAPEASDRPRAALRGPTDRVPIATGLDGPREIKIAARGIDRIQLGRESIELRAVEQLVDESQTRAIAAWIARADGSTLDGVRSLSEILDALERSFDERGLDLLGPFYSRHPDQHPGNFARPRRFEIAAAVNRMRGLKMRQH